MNNVTRLLRTSILRFKIASLIELGETILKLLNSAYQSDTFLFFISEVHQEQEVLITYTQSRIPLPKDSAKHVQRS